jgi:hypothetical protein
VTGRDGLYHSPSATGDGRLVVSYRAPDADSYGVRVIDPGSGESIEVYDTARWHELGAVVARARTVPAGRSSVVDDRATTGLLYCLDSSLTNLATTPDGPIESVQIFDAAAGGERLLATAAVASDGSFYLKVPARTGLRLRTLDAQGEVLQSMRSWFWVMPGESRGCIGCHENRELTPPNRHALALRKPPQVVGPPEAAAP